MSIPNVGEKMILYSINKDTGVDGVLLIMMNYMNNNYNNN